MSQLHNVEIEIDVAKELIAVRDSYVKLSDNKFFKEVILEGYFKKEAARLVMAKSNPNLDEAMQKNLDNKILGVGGLVQYFNEILRVGDMAQEALGQQEQTREEILAEEIN